MSDFAYACSDPGDNDLDPRYQPPRTLSFLEDYTGVSMLLGAAASELTNDRARLYADLTTHIQMRIVLLDNAGSATSSVGFFYSTDGGSSWTALGSTLACNTTANQIQVGSWEDFPELAQAEVLLRWTAADSVGTPTVTFNRVALELR